MASKDKQTPQEQISVENINDHLTMAGKQLAENKKILYWAFGIIVAVGVCVAAYVFIYLNPRVNKSMEAFNNVEISALGSDSLRAEGYKKVADKFSGTPGGNIASLSAAETLYELGKYDQAVKYVKKFKTSDDVLMANAQILLGDCYVNLKKYDDAISAFKEACDTGEGNSQIVPRALLKLATVYDAQKKYDKALECYEELLKEYPNFALGNGLTVEAYAERERARMGK